MGDRLEFVRLALLDRNTLRGGNAKRLTAWSTPSEGVRGKRVVPRLGGVGGSSPHGSDLHPTGTNRNLSVHLLGKTVLADPIANCL